MPDGRFLPMQESSFHQQMHPQRVDLHENTLSISPLSLSLPGAQFACFTSTNVQNTDTEVLRGRRALLTYADVC
jgi:hypothetical protein